MVKGKTSTGFEFEVDETAMDYEFVEDLQQLAGGNGLVLPGIIERLLGADQKDALKDHVRDKDGRVPVSAMEAEVIEIMRASRELKNS